MERFGGARQRHVEQIDIVDMRIDRLAVELLGETRFGHRLLEPDREAPRSGGFALRLGPHDVLHPAPGLGVELPRTIELDRKSVV